MSKSVGIIGCGAWGTALAKALSRDGNDVLAWDKNPEIVAQINTHHENRKRLPGITLPDNIVATEDADLLAKNCDVIFVVCPATANTQVAANFGPLLTNKHTVVLCAKGFRESDGALLSEVWYEAAGNLQNLAVLSGPSFALEVANGLPVSVVVASRQMAVIEQVRNLFKDPSFRIYSSDDVIGAQIGGAFKNIIAIAAGLVDGLELGHNFKAAILCRGLVEMMKFGEAYGAQSETFVGLSGMGDLILSTTSVLSRNYRLGQRLGQGVSIKEAIQASSGHAEGLMSTRIVAEQAVARGIDLGIVSAVDGILSGSVSPKKAFEYLHLRPIGPESADSIILKSVS